MFSDEERRITDRLLTTTRAARKRLDLERPVDRDLIVECLAIASQAPTGSNLQHWRWLVVTDPTQRAALAEVYRRSFEGARSEIVTGYTARTAADRELVDPAQLARVMDSAGYLVEHLAEVPVLVIPCLRAEPGSDDAFSRATLYGSIYPAVWSFQLACYSRGLGTVLTTGHLGNEAEAARILGLPDDVMQAALIPVAHLRGAPFKPAARRPIEELIHWDAWQRA